MFGIKALRRRVLELDELHYENAKALEQIQVGLVHNGLATFSHCPTVVGMRTEITFDDHVIPRIQETTLALSHYLGLEFDLVRKSAKIVCRKAKKHV